MSSLRGHRVLVIGGLGFIGANLSRHLHAEGAIVTVLTPSRGRHAEDAQEFDRVGIAVREGDIRRRDDIAAAVAGQDVIFNLSGQSGAVRSMEDPWTDLDVNCGGALSLLEAVRAVNQKARVVFTGSRLEYGRVGSSSVGEDHPTDPLCLHAIHKLTVEQYLKLYRQLFGLRYVIARITNPYGPGQPRSRTAYGVVNRLIHLALSNDVLPIYGDGSQRRDYIYIDDTVAALCALAVAPDAEGIYNVGNGVGTPLVEMARAITKISGGGRIEFVEWPPLDEKIETGDFVADITRIRRETGWSPAVAVDEGLRRTVAHYRMHIAS